MANLSLRGAHGWELLLGNTAREAGSGRKACAGRIPTATLLNAAWKACQEAEKDALRSTVLSQAGQHY